MKKMMMVVLVLALMVSMAIPASAAVRSAAGTAEDLKPLIVSSTCDKLNTYSMEAFDELPEETQELLTKAKEALTDVVPEGMAVRYFLYVDICDICKEATVVFQLNDYSEVAFMQYVNGEWMELEFTDNGDGTFTVTGIVDGPFAIFVK